MAGVRMIEVLVGSVVMVVIAMSVVMMVVVRVATHGSILPAH
jgi:hypothetical protein